MAAGRARGAALTTIASRTALDARQRLLAVGLVLAVTLVAFEVTAIITALPTITRELGGDSLYGVSLAVYTLANMVVLVAAGEAADRHGPALPFVMSIVTFVIGLVVAAAAPTMVWVVVGRLLQGAGTGAFSPIAYVLVRRAFPDDRQPMMYAFLSAGWVLPSLVAPLIAGWITSAFGWRWVFLAIVPAALTVGALATRPMLDLRPLSGPRRPSRIPAAAAAAGGVGLLVTGLQFADPWAATAATLGGGAVALPALRRLLPAGVARLAQGLAAVVVARILATAAFLGVDSFIPLAADRVHGASPIAQGFTIIGAAISWTLGQWLRARRPDRSPSRSVGEGFAVMAVGVLLCVGVLWDGWPLWAVFLGWAVGGFGMGLLFNPTTVTAMGYAPRGNEGLVSSQAALADAIGFSLMGGVGGAVVAVADRRSLPVEGAIGINFALAFALAIVGVLVSRRIHAAR